MAKNNNENNKNNKNNVTSGTYVLVLSMFLIMVKYLIASEDIEMSWSIVFAPIIIYLLIKMIIAIIKEIKESKESKD